MLKKHYPWYIRFVDGSGEPGGAPASADAGDTAEPESAGKAPVEDSDVEKWKAHARLWEDRAKANQKAAEKLKELEDAQKSEAERNAEALAQAKADLEKERARNKLLQVAAETGVPASLLEGAGEDVNAYAKALQEWASSRSPETGKKAIIKQEGGQPHEPTIDEKIAAAQKDGDRLGVIAAKLLSLNSPK